MFIDLALGDFFSPSEKQWNAHAPSLGCGSILSPRGTARRFPSLGHPPHSQKHPSSESAMWQGQWERQMAWRSGSLLRLKRNRSRRQLTLLLLSARWATRAQADRDEVGIGVGGVCPLKQESPRASGTTNSRTLIMVTSKTTLGNPKWAVVVARTLSSLLAPFFKGIVASDVTHNIRRRVRSAPVVGYSFACILSPNLETVAQQ